MSQMHFEGVRGSIYSAAVECDRCRCGVCVCVVFQADDPHYTVQLCKKKCWPALQAAIAANEEIPT